MDELVNRTESVQVQIQYTLIRFVASPLRVCEQVHRRRRVTQQRTAPFLGEYGAGPRLCPAPNFT